MTIRERHSEQYLAHSMYCEYWPPCVWGVNVHKTYYTHPLRLRALLQPSGWMNCERLAPCPLLTTRWSQHSHPRPQGSQSLSFQFPCLANEKTPKEIDLDQVKVVVGPATVRSQIFCQHVILPAGGVCVGGVLCLVNELPAELRRPKHLL